MNLIKSLKLNNVKELAVIIVSMAIFFYPFICGFIGAPPSLVFRPTYLLLLFILGILVLPSKIFPPNSLGEHILNGVVILGIIANIWIARSWISLMLTFDLSILQLFAGASLILAAMEITRRTSVKVMNYVAVPALAYALLGNHLPGLFGHAGMSFERLIWTQLCTSDGLFGTPLAIGATYIGLFVFFSAFLEASGASDKFMRFTMAIAGTFTGGPAKVAIVASSLMGMISGSSVTNVVTTGVITIPLMKKAGYKGSFAGGVEATASLGSQITPPIMGATAFLISEFTGHSYIEIIGIAIVPCLLYYLGVFSQVHLYSHKMKIGGLPKSELPDLKKSTLEVLPFIIPIILLVYLLYRRYSPEYAISYGIIAFLVVILLDRKTRAQFFKNFATGIKNGAKSCLPLVSSLAIAGLIIGILTMTGLGDRLSYIITGLAGGNFTLLILYTAIVCMILGMGLVTIGAYVLVAVLTAPIIVQMGVPVLAAHFFIFYFAVVSAISPPVMVGVFAASSLAESSPMATAGQALRLAIVGFIVPVLFIYNPDLLLINGINLRSLFFIGTAAVGIVSIAMAFERYSLFSKIPIWKAILFFIIGILNMIPTTTYSVAGVVLFISLMTYEYFRGRKLTATSTTS